MFREEEYQFPCPGFSGSLVRKTVTHAGFKSIKVSARSVVSPAPSPPGLPAGRLRGGSNFWLHLGLPPGGGGC